MSAAGARRRLPVVNPGRLHVVNPGSDSDDSDDFRRPRREDTGLSFPWLSSPTNSSADRESPPTPHDPVEPLFLHGQPANRTVKLNPNPPQPFSPPTSTVPTRNGLPRRPSSPPSTISPEQTSTTPSPAYAIADKTLILVTSDSSLYANVEITGATTAAFIREKIFTALNIFDDEDQSRFSIYRTEIGQYAIGDALTDDRLYEICRASGDSKGSLKLLVSHTSATVHDPNYRPPIQPAHSITPPVLPQYTPATSTQPQTPLPLQPSSRSRSRHGSVSSTSEHAGYDADLDNADRDNSHRNTIRPPPHQTSFSCVQGPSAPLPPSPLANRRPSAPQQSRPSSPPAPLSNTLQLDRNREQREQRDRDTIIDRYGNMLQVPPPPPPPLSPNRLTFGNDDIALTPRNHLHTHTRAGSETAAEQQANGHDLRDWRTQQPSRTRAEQSGIPVPHRRPSKQNSEHESIGRAESWVIVDEPTSQTPPENPRRSPAASRGARQMTSPQRYKGNSSYGRALNIPAAPRHPPPAPPTGGTEVHGRMSPSRPLGQAVPAHWPVSWKGEQKGEQKMKFAKSMDNLRLAASPNPGTMNHPMTLLPGGPSAERSRRNALGNPPNTHLPSRPNGLTNMNSASSTTMRSVRPLPVKGGPSHSTSMEFTPPTNSRSISSTLPPNQEPYPRPLSAMGDSATSPVHRGQPRSYQSPTVFSGDSTDSLRSPHALSPTQHLPLPGSLASRSTATLLERPMPLPTPPQPPPRSSPPRSPTSPRSPPQYPVDRLASSISETSSTASPPSASASESGESTLRDGKDWLTKFFESSGGSGTVIPPPRSNAHLKPPLPPIPVAPPPPPSSSSSSGTMISMRSTRSMQSDDYSDSDDDYAWNKPPAARPPLTVRIDSSPSSSPKGHPLPMPNANLSSTRDDPVPPPAGTPTPQRRPSATRRDKEARKRLRGSTFTAAEDAGWATRPPPEDMYERLEEFFPEHDLDRPVIEAGSGGTSPTAVELPPVPVPPIPEPSSGVKARVKGKKSIRYVAQEHKKRIDRTSRALVAEGGGTDSESYAASMLRKRSTKLWGSKLEEVTPAQAKASPSHPEASPGGPTTFKWVRGELIGKGTYGRVYLAMNATTGEMMAVKQVDAPRTLSDRNDSRQITVVQALKMESETLKDLDHPNIVQYLGFEETPAHLSIFLEYVPGGSIGSVLLKHGKLAEEITISFAAQILDGLEYLHSKGILHRDLKADNILVEMEGVCKISDFGISKRTAESDGAGTAMQGTVYWMAPEVINPQGKPYNFKVDIWSLGCVVLEMLAGTRPWTGDEMFAVMFKLYQEKQPPPVPSGVVLSELGDDFLRRKCFAINPDDRPTAAELRNHKYLELPPDWQFTGFS